MVVYINTNIEYMIEERDLGGEDRGLDFEERARIQVLADRAHHRGPPLEDFSHVCIGE